MLDDILTKGTYKPAARENMPETHSLFGYQIRHDLSEGFPLLTTKKLSFKNIVTELLWFLRGDTNIKYLVDNGCNIWNEDAYNYYKKKGGLVSFEEFKLSLGKTCGVSGITLGDCGKQYGWLWRHWDGLLNDFEWDEEHNGTTIAKEIDQIQDVIDGLKKNPMSRRHIISAWNPATLNDMALNACHCFVQFNCRPRKYWNTDKELTEYDLRGSEVDDKIKELNLPLYYLDCKFTMRSCDSFLGCPYNIASYALLTHIIAKICNMQVAELIVDFGDVHIYEPHLEIIKEQIQRTPKELPQLKINGGSLNEYYIEYGLDKTIELISTPNIFELENYKPYDSLKGKLFTGLS